MEPGAAFAKTFVGRKHELAALGACLDTVAAGSAAIALLVGEPGIGKTRLAE
jgi:predicted ATPase